MDSESRHIPRLPSAKTALLKLLTGRSEKILLKTMSSFIINEELCLLMINLNTQVFACEVLFSCSRVSKLFCSNPHYARLWYF